MNESRVLSSGYFKVQFVFVLVGLKCAGNKWVFPDAGPWTVVKVNDVFILLQLYLKDWVRRGIPLVPWNRAIQLITFFFCELRADVSIPGSVAVISA